MFLLKKPIFQQWFFVSKPGLIALIWLESDSEDFNSTCLKFHYHSCKHLLLFLYKTVKLLKTKEKSFFEEKIDSETFGGMKNGKVYFRNSADFELVFEHDDFFFLFISGLADVLPSIILPNKSETKSFINNCFEEDTLFFKAHETFIKYYRMLLVLQNKVDNDKK